MIKTLPVPIFKAIRDIGKFGRKGVCRFAAGV